MKKILLIIIPCLIAAACVAAILLLGHRNTGGSGAAEQESEVNKDIAMTKVEYGSLQSVYTAVGRVVSTPSEFVDVYTAEGNSIEILQKKGAEINEGDLLCKTGEGKVLSGSDGLIVDIVQQDNVCEISVLNYSKLYIDIYIPRDMAQKITYETQVQVFSGGKEYAAEIDLIGYIYTEQGVELRITFDGYIMPNMEAEVRIDLGETPEVLYIPAAFVNMMGDFSYVYLVNDYENNEYEQCQVMLGNKYTVIEEKDTFDYYEIISGLEEGQIISTGPLIIYY